MARLKNYIGRKMLLQRGDKSKTGKVQVMFVPDGYYYGRPYGRERYVFVIDNSGLIPISSNGDSRVRVFPANGRKTTIIPISLIERLSERRAN